MKDKIIFWIDSSIIYYGIAKFMQDKYECEKYAMLDVLDRQKDFFENQNFVDFKKIWFYHDNVKKNKKQPDIQYLQNIEKKYNLNLWQLAFNERNLYQFNEFYTFTTDEVLSILEQECRLFEQVVNEVKPNFLIMLEPGYHHSQIFYEICKANGVKPLVLISSRFGYMYNITTTLDTIEGRHDYDVQKEVSFEELQEYLRKFNTFRQGNEFKKRFQSSKSALVKSLIEFFLFSNNSNLQTHYTYYGRTKFRVLYKYLMLFTRRSYRKSFVDRNLSREVKDDIPFVFYPLHIEVERSTLILTPFFVNQYEVIKGISQSLPVGYKLLVKEHHAQSTRNWRPISFYKAVSKLPNVELIHYSVPPDEILKKCSLVIALTGTSALEAGFYGKPAILFGLTTFSWLPHIKKINSFEELPNAIRSSLKIKVNPKDILTYIKLADDNSFQFDYDGFGQDMQDHFQYGGYYADTKISNEKMKVFLEEEKIKFETLVSEYLKKIEKLKQSAVPNGKISTEPAD